MSKYLVLLGLLPFFLLCSCSHKEKREPVFDAFETTDDDDDVSDDYLYESGEEVVIPFVEESGVKYVDVSINGVGVQMIFDTGCSATSISLAEANYLYNKGLLTSDDILGVTQSQLANGKIETGMMVNLREVIIDEQIRCIDVEAHVESNPRAPLLLGNAVLDRVATITIDNENKNLIFKIK